MSFTEILTKGLISQSGSASSYVLGIIAVAVASYLIGSVNFAVIFSNCRGDDIREHGSGNAGTTNVMRTYGRGAGIAIFSLDFLKSVICVFLGILLMPADGYGYVAALFCMAGHAYPVYFGFRGGKGVAVYVGAMMCLNPLAAAISILVYALFLLFSKYISLSSIAMTLVFPIVNFYFGFSLFKVDTSNIRGLVNYILCTAIPIFMSAFVCMTHISNIKRLIAGTETRVGENNREKK